MRLASIMQSIKPARLCLPALLRGSKPTLAPNNTNNILITHHMRQPNPLRNMPRTGAPNKRILETLLQRPMNGIAHILNSTLIPHNKRLAEVRLDTFALGVDADQAQFFPAALHDVLDAQVELAGHDAGVGFMGQGVEVFEGDGVDLVVDVEAFDVGAMVFHYYVDELVDCCCDWRLVVR